MNIIEDELDWFKVEWATVDGSVHLSDWLSERNARRLFAQRKNEKTLKTKWAEILRYDENETVIVDRFERKVMNVIGYDIIV